MAIRKFAHLAALLTANLLAHFWLFVFADVFKRVAPMNDVLLYGYWLQQMQADGAILGVNQDFVYPAPALIPMFLAKLLGGNLGILVGWTTMVAVLSSLALIAMAQASGSSKASFLAGWFWVTSIMLLGPVSISRIDVFAAILALFGVVAIAQSRLRTAISLFTFGAWIKIWPFALALGMFFAERGKNVIAAIATGLSFAILLGAFLFGGNLSVLSFLYTQGDRGIQIESVVATFWLWAAKLGLPNAGIYFDQQMLTNQVSGIYAVEVGNLITLAMFVALAITGWLGWRAAKAGATRVQVFAAVGLTAVLDLIVFNKVGSPQFMIWLAVPIAAWIFFELPSAQAAVVFGLTISALTQLVYPILYIDLMGLGDSSMLALTARNVGLLLFLVWANRQLCSLAKTRAAA
ncbi:MAG: hypothetical protein RL100_898 [Actinomycetota bacterium]|jgi:hypothetical protein